MTDTQIHAERATTDLLRAPHAHDAAAVVTALVSSHEGLGAEEVTRRRETYGPNELPATKSATLLSIVLHQFKSPLIYLLLVAAIVAGAAGEHSDAIIIAAILVINAIIGSTQEYGAERSAAALATMVPTKAVVRREGSEETIDARDIVPGDIVVLEAGAKVPADIRLTAGASVESDESLLTGESLAVAKSAAQRVESDAPLGDRKNMLFAGALITRGHATGVVTGTAADTQLGKLATSLDSANEARPPLLQRMDRFANGIAVVIGLVSLVVAVALAVQGESWLEILLVCVALAVAAIPEGLPIGLTVALSLATRRMSRRNVIARKLVAVEALGSCTFIASDKTGTLTLNELTTTHIAIPGSPALPLSGRGMQPEGALETDDAQLREAALRLTQTAVLCNDGTFEKRDHIWHHHGDAVDVALLVVGHKMGCTRETLAATHREVARIPFDPDIRLAASLRDHDGERTVHVKGAPEALLARCTAMARAGGDAPLDSAVVLQQADELAAAGYRVLAFAAGSAPDDDRLSLDDLRDMTFLGLAAMIDPLRPEAKQAVADCRAAGIEVAMVTGDHPVTALAISKQLGLADEGDEAVTGDELRKASERGGDALRELVRGKRVFARVEPQQKLQIVEALSELGHFVAVTGDGANDAPALKRGHVGVSMAMRGTDVAREASTLIVTDDNFASIVAGIEEGRVAYNNVRKVTFLLVATAATSVLMFISVLLMGLPIPLVAVQLLWLNLVTNGIQDVALAFEPGEGDELRHAPRRPGEAIFDRLMVERVLLTCLTMAPVVSAMFWWMLNRGGYDVEQARNVVLLMFVVFGNILVGASRSEEHAVLLMSPLRNKVLIFGTLAATCVHLLSMQFPAMQRLLEIAPLPALAWAFALGAALLPFAVLELHKWLRFGRSYWRGAGLLG